MKNDIRYSTLVSLWIHHNTTQFQWPSIILSTVFVAVSIVVGDDNVFKLANPSKWGVDVEVMFGAGLPLLVIGIGTMIMSYTMSRARKIMKSLELELDQIHYSFSKLNHPKCCSGAKMIWGFMEFISLLGIVFGLLFSFGITWCLFISLLIIIIIWFKLLLYGLK